MRKTMIRGAAAVVMAAGLALSTAVPANAGIKLFADKNWGSYLGDFGRGTSYVGAVADDYTSSLEVSSPANYAVLYQFRDYGGCYTGRFYIGYDNLAQKAGYAVYGGCDGFNDRTSSVG